MTDTNENKPLETWIKDNQHSAPSGTNTFVINVLRLAEFERLVRQEEREKWAGYVSISKAKVLERELANAKEKIERLEKDKERYAGAAFKAGAMHKAPCFYCGYNGEGYYQPNKHPCAERHHAAM